MYELRLENFDRILSESLTLDVPSECLQISINNPSRKTVKEELKKHKLFKYYEYIPAIIDIMNNITTSPITQESKQIIRNEYIKYLQYRDKSKPIIPTRYFIYCIVNNINIPFSNEERDFFIRRFPFIEKYNYYKDFWSF